MTPEEGERKKIDFTNEILSNDLFPIVKQRKKNILIGIYGF